MTSEEIETDWFNETVEGIETDYAIKDELRIEAYLVPIISVLIFIIGVLGNGTMITIFVKERNMRNMSNIYIMSLTIAGLLVTVFVVPFYSLSFTLNSWPYGSIICKSSWTIYVLTNGVPAFTLVALGAEQYLAFKKKFRKSKIKRWTILSVILIWVLGSITSLPTAIFSHEYRYIFVDNSSILMCHQFPIDTDMYIKYDIVLRSLISYIIPFLIITYLYVTRDLHRVPYTSSQNLQGEFDNEQNFNEVKKRRQLDWMVLLLAIVFFICFLPHYIFQLCLHLNIDVRYNFNKYWQALEVVAFCLSLFYSCVNPIILYFVSDTYKLHLKKYFCKFR